MRTVIRNALVGAIIAAVPVTSTIAAVRPNAAVPTAGSTAVAAQVYDTNYDNRRNAFAEGWPVLLFGAAMGVLVVIMMLEDDDNEDMSLTRA